MQEENIKFLLDDFEYRNKFQSSNQVHVKPSTKNKENFSDYLSSSQKEYVQEVI